MTTTEFNTRRELPRRIRSARAQVGGPVGAATSGPSTVALLAAEYGRTGVAPFLANPGVTPVLLCGGRAVAGYARVGRWAVVPGDVAAPKALQDVALEEFLAELAERRLRPALLAISDPEPFRELGFHCVEIADEAVVDLAGFTLAGSRRANLRHSTTSARRLPLEVLPYAAWQDDQVAEISAQWLRTKRGGELGFTLSRHEDVSRQVAEGSADLWVIVDPTGTVQAWCTWRHYLGGRGRVVDIMRRRSDAPNPAMDALLVTVIEHYRDRGLSEISLASVPRSHGALGERIFPARSLHAFKSKFAPVWSPRWLAVPARRHELPALAAVGRAYCPGGLRRAIFRNS